MRRPLIGLIVLAALVFLFTFSKVYAIRGSGGGILYWNANEALLFMGESYSGAHSNGVRYTLEAVLRSVIGVKPPDDERCAKIAVLRVTDRQVEHYDQDLGCVTGLVPFQGYIYAISRPKLWKWSTSYFELASPQELNAFDAAKAAAGPTVSHPWQFDDVQGWSMRWLGYTDPKYQLTIDGQPLTILYYGRSFSRRPLSVVLIRPTQAPQTIWSFDEGPRRISRAEYEKIFGRY